MNEITKHMAMQLGARGYLRQPLDGSNPQVNEIVSEVANRRGMRIYRSKKEIKDGYVHSSGLGFAYVLLLPIQVSDKRIWGNKVGARVAYVKFSQSGKYRYCQFGNFDNNGSPLDGDAIALRKALFS